MNNIFCEPCRFIKSSGYGTTATEFVILTDRMYNLENHMGFKLILCQTIPSVATALPVFIQINGVNYPLIDKFGNTIRVDELKTRCPYLIVFGTDPAHFIALNVCCVSINYESSPIPAVAEVTVDTASVKTATALSKKATAASVSVDTDPTASKKIALATTITNSPVIVDLTKPIKEVK